MSVKELQKYLNQIINTNLINDGIKGRNTNHALMTFQAKYGLTVTAELDSSTINKINEILKLNKPTIKKENSLLQQTLNKTIIKIAYQYIGLVEIKSNTKWDDLKTIGHDERAKKLVKWLKESGHQDGWAYCQSFCEAVYREAYELHGSPEPATSQIKKNITPSVMNTYTAFEKLGKITKKPNEGAIGFMRKGKSWSGHAFLVEKTDSKYIYTIEGNTSSHGATVEADRNGDLIISKKRPLNFVKTNGLYLIGFVNPYT